MKISPDSPLHVSLNWDVGDVQNVGRLAWRDRRAWFEFDEGFLRSGLDLSPVHLHPGPGVHTSHDVGVFEGLHGVFNDSLPDGWGRLLLDRRARQIGIEPATLTPLDRLACVGTNGIGALSYQPTQKVWQETASSVDLDKLANDAQLVLEGAVGNVISELGQVGGSPGGARPKALIAIDKTGQAIYGSTEIPDDYIQWLVKFAGHDDPDDIANIELAYASIAQAAGVTMSATQLLSGTHGTQYFATQRFDCEGTRRRHIHSASGLLYADIRFPGLDYQELIALTRHVTRDQRDIRAMFTLAVFNVLAHNRDDHARQFSFAMDRDGAWHFAPAYDLTFAHGPGGEHSTTVLGNGKDISRDHLLDLGRKADIKKSESLVIIDQVAHAVADWNQIAQDCGVSRASRTSIAKSLASVRI